MRIQQKTHFGSRVQPCYSPKGILGVPLHLGSVQLCPIRSTRISLCVGRPTTGKQAILDERRKQKSNIRSLGQSNSQLDNSIRSRFHLEAGRESVSPLIREYVSILLPALKGHQAIRNACNQNTPNCNRKSRAEVCRWAPCWKGRQGWRLCDDSPRARHDP